MPSEVLYSTSTDFTGGRRFRSNSVIAETISSPTSSSGGSLTFLKKLWREKKNDKKISIIDYDETSSNSPSPTMFRKNRRASAQPSSLSVNTNQLISNNNNNLLKIEESKSRSPSPSLFRRGLGRRSSTSNEKTQENLLHYHVSHQDYSALEKLFSESADTIDINYMRPPGVAALHQACALGNVKIVSLLIQRGADLQQKTWSGLSPLKIAVLSGGFEVAQYLVSVGANSDDIKDGCQVETPRNSSYPKRNNSF